MTPKPPSRDVSRMREEFEKFYGKNYSSMGNPFSDIFTEEKYKIFQAGYNAAMAEPHEAAKGGGWLPIESVPKREFVLCINAYGQCMVNECNEQGDWGLWHIEPTHWQPLPSTPEQL